MLESRFQSRLIRELEIRFPGCVVIKNDAGYLQGVPDLLILFGQHWAMLECKQQVKSRHRPNQNYYIDKFDDMSYATFIFPENMEEVLNEMESLFKS